jgi:hypothetical protein
VQVTELSRGGVIVADDGEHAGPHFLDLELADVTGKLGGLTFPVQLARPRLSYLLRLRPD